MACGITVLFVLIFSLRLSIYIPNDGIGALFTLPIALTALRFGPWWGAAAAMLAVGLFAIWAVRTNGPDPNLVTIASRAVVFGTIGWGLGYFERVRERMIVERDIQRQHIESLLSELGTARAEERARIASELHDFVLQQLLVSLMHVEQVRTALSDPSLARIDQHVRDATASLRRIIDGIQPMDIDHMATAGLLEHAVAWIERDFSIDIAADLGALPEIGPGNVRLLVFRLTMESLRNAAKHAFADAISVVAVQRGDVIRIRIEDDGIGLSEPVDVQDSVIRSYGTGFNLLLDRFLALGGHSAVRSVPGAGTVIELDVPVGSTMS